MSQDYQILVVSSSVKRQKDLYAQLIAQYPGYRIHHVLTADAVVPMMGQAAAAGLPYALIYIDVHLESEDLVIETIDKIWDLNPYTEIALHRSNSNKPLAQNIQRVIARGLLPFIDSPLESGALSVLTDRLLQKWQQLSESMAFTLRLQNESNFRLRCIKEYLTDTRYTNKHGAQISRAVASEVDLHDPLTRLPARPLLLDRLRQTLEMARRDARPFAFAVLNIDHFKEINDTYGHQVGDRVLQLIGGRLQHQLRTSDTVARLNGDEFALILHGADRESIVPVIDKITSAIEEPMGFQSHSLLVSCSIGLTYYPEHGEDADTLLNHAEVAMNQAREAASPFKVFDAEAHNKVSDQFLLYKDLETAVRQQSLQLNYQPIVDLHNNSLYGLEALCRWIHPTRGYVPPDRFISLAEQKGLIKPLTEVVLSQGLQEIAAWHKQGLKVRISINLSARNFMDPQLPKLLAQLIEQYRCDPQYVTLEITEGMMMTDPDRALRIAQQFREMGVELSLDDYGTGYSSLAYLKRLPVKELKIDRSFIQNLDNDAESRVIVKSTIELAHNLGLRVVAEGVENSATLDLLQALECDRVQGYYICKPNYSPEIARWLGQSMWQPVRYAT